MNEVTRTLQVLIDVFVLLLDAPVLDELPNRAPRPLAQVVPDEAELTFRLVQKSSFNLLAIELTVVLQQMIKICRASDLQKVGEVTPYFHYPPGVAVQPQPRLR